MTAMIANIRGVSAHAGHGPKCSTCSNSLTIRNHLMRCDESNFANQETETPEVGWPNITQLISRRKPTFKPGQPHHHTTLLLKKEQNRLREGQ